MKKVFTWIGLKCASEAVFILSWVKNTSHYFFPISLKTTFTIFSVNQGNIETFKKISASVRVTILCSSVNLTKLQWCIDKLTEHDWKRIKSAALPCKPLFQVPNLYEKELFADFTQICSRRCGRWTGRFPATLLTALLPLLLPFLLWRHSATLV